VLGRLRGISCTSVRRFLQISKVSSLKYWKLYREGGTKLLFARKPSNSKKSDNESIKRAAFTLLHSPPAAYGINRTTWRMIDLQRILREQTSLADGSDALTTVMLNALKANYGGARANEFDLLLSHYSEEVRKFSESMKRDRFCSISNKRFAEWIERRVSMDEQANRELRRLRSFSVKRLWHRIGQALASAGTNLRNKLGYGGGLQGNMVDKERPERVRHLAIEISDLLNTRRPDLGYGLNALNTVMLTAIEATHGREKANEYDLLNAWFSEEVRRFSGGRVQ
jgi:hypothetical protein